MTMTIKEAQTARRKLEAQLKELVTAFEADTGVDICAVHLHRVQALGSRHKIESVEVDTRLGRY